MRYWVVSPNVSAIPSEQPEWEKAILERGIAMMGWGRDNEIGARFQDEIKHGDFILIAQGANRNKRLFIGGLVSSDVIEEHINGTPRKASYRKLSHVLSRNELERLNLDFNGTAYGDADRIPALYVLHPDRNNADKLLTIRLQSAIDKKIKIMKNQEIVNLLKYKKQIILQGPPGTGKTKLAKELADELAGVNDDKFDDNNLRESDILTALNSIRKIRTVAGNVEYEIIKVDEYNKAVILKKSTETEAVTSFAKIIEFYSNNRWQKPIENSDDRRAAALAGYIFENRFTWKKVVPNEQVKIIQFHPSYSYEDFVRGIISTPNLGEGGGVIYKVENKVLAAFAEAALNNYRKSTLSSEVEFAPQSRFKQQLEIFIEQVNEAIDKNGFYTIGPDTTAKIVGITDTSFVYSFDKRPDIKYQLLFSDLNKIDNHPLKVKRTLDVRDIAVGYLTMIGKHPYYFKVYNLIKSIELSHPVEVNAASLEKGKLKNYILIIDEINRANLSSVLGELIYALEYRGKEVNSMYAIDENNKLILPSNLYIIGTMNTADRSVGHIDYAIRRRFAFVDVLPKDLSAELGEDFKQEYFNKVYNLFYNKDNGCLSSEFEPGQVCLGHSYFIQQYKKDTAGNKTLEKVDFDIRLKYEIVPILEEYLRDGVLKDNETVRKTIAELKGVTGA